MTGQIPFSIRMESAKGEMNNAVIEIRRKYGLPNAMMDGILSSVLADVRSNVKTDLINEVNEILRDKNEELDAAKAAAKKTLEDEPQAEQEERA